MTSLYAQLSPSPFGPAHVIGPDGTHEFTRVYFDNGHFQLGWGNDKLGACSILSADVTTNGPIVLQAHDGRRVIVPAHIVQSVTYKAQ